MKLNKNEKRTLRLLLNDAKISDRSIANQLKISSQAVGKIRHKLEKSVITSYSLNLNYSKVGVQTFAMALARITQEGVEEGEIEVEEKLQKEPHVLQVYRIPSGNITHIILYGFKDIQELETFFHSPRKKQDLHKFVENREMFTFSHNSFIKNNSVPLFHKIIESMDAEEIKREFQEMENFKKRNWG